MSLLKASAISAIGAGVKLTFGLVLIKIVSVMLGPSGLGLMGQLMSITAVLGLLAGGGIATGIARYVSEHKGNTKRLREFLSAARGYSLVASLGLFVIGVSIAKPLSLWLFKEPGFEYLIYILSVVQAGVAVNIFIQSIATGHADVVSVNIINISSAFLGLIALVPFVYFWGKSGMLIGLVILPGLPALISLWIAKRKYPSALHFEWKTNKADINGLLGYSLMVAVSATTMPVAQTILRGYVAEQLGWEQAGFWQATLRLSDSYLLFINMVLGSYYLPTLCEISPGKKQIGYVLFTLKRLLPMVAVVALAIWIFKDYIIRLLFSNSFLPASRMLTYQLIGDFFKIGSHTIGYLVVANAWIRLSILADILQAGLFLTLSWLLFSTFNELAVSISYALSYALYFALVLMLLGFTWKKKNF